MKCNFNGSRWWLQRQMIMGDRAFLYANRRKACNCIDNMGESHFRKDKCRCYMDLLDEHRRRFDAGEVSESDESLKPTEEA